MKTIVLTVEYELFFGSDSGTVENSMIRPMRKLITILNRHQMKCTIFWDVMHYIRLCQLAKDNPALTIDKELIEKQIHYLIAWGHDVQMHLHPHWLDATWDGNKWKFSYERYTLHQLSTTLDASDMNTLLGCVTACRQAMEQVCRGVDPNYSVKAFRAGSNSIIPFETLANALAQNNILVDSSTAYGMTRYKSFAPYDFSKMSKQLYFRFEQSPMETRNEGPFIEFPVETVKVPFIKRFTLNQIRRIKYIYPGRYGDGNGLGESHIPDEISFRDLFRPRYVKLSPEDSFPEEFQYLLSKSRNNAIMKLQPKNMSPFTHSILSKTIENKQLKFISLAQRLAEID